MILKVYDVSIINFTQHPSQHVKTVYDMLEREWEYGEGDWDMKKFASECCKCLKRERTRLRNYWNTKCDQKRDVPGPTSLNSEVWSRLVGYWTSPAGLEVSKKMASHRKSVTDLTRVGRGGIAAKQQTMVKYMNREAFIICTQWYSTMGMHLYLLPLHAFNKKLLMYNANGLM